MPHLTDSTLSKLGFVGFFSDAKGLQLESYRKMFPRRETQEYEWHSSIKVFPNRQPPKEKISGLKHVMLAPLYMREATGTRHFAPRVPSDSFSLPPLRRIVQDERWPGLHRRDRPARELSLEASMTRKRHVEISASSERPLPDYTPGFFREGAPVPGASFVLGRAGTPGAHKLNAFVAERRQPLRRAVDVEAAQLREAEAREVAQLQAWEREVLKDCDPRYQDPDAVDRENDE